MEEILVYGKILAEQPLATVSIIPESKINSCTPKDLGEIMNYTSGTYLTIGQKDESQVQIRGLSSNRLTILYDGIPVYEPYFNTFDLKTMPAEDIENIRVIKGANSVLYGANSMGGVIDVITKHSEKPFIKLRSELSENSTYLISGSGGYNFNKLDLLGSATWDHSDGFDWKDNGTHLLRAASDYKGKNLMGKIHYYPTDKSEIFGQVLFYQSEYGIPPATEFVKPRYWRFDDWQRLQASLGSSFPIFSNGTLKARFYYIRHYNVLDAYKKSDYKDLQWESTYKNNTVGAFILGEKPLSLTNRLHFSVNAKSDHVNTQSAVGAAWEKYHQDIYSFGAEDWFRERESLLLGTAGVANEAVGVEEAFAVIRWYQYFIAAKLTRAIQGKVEEEEEGEKRSEEFPSDADGSAKIALIAIERSLGAWAVIPRQYALYAERVYEIISFLDHLRQAVEETFHGARSFIRPGFD